MPTAITLTDRIWHPYSLGRQRITDAVERVRTLGSFTPDDLGLDTESGLVLCRRLIREGLLEVVR